MGRADNGQSYTGFTAVQTYSYDSLNRIKDAKEMIGQTQQWKQTFQYDRYGNRRFDTANNNTTTIAPTCPAEVCNPQIDPATNKLIGYHFDASGNTRQDAENRTFIYDGENKQVEVKDASGNTIGQYFYNGDGQRIKKLSATESTVFIYNASGQLVAEYATQIAQGNAAKVSYLTTDHLGSPRITTDANGQVTSRRDFQPFGEEIERLSYGFDNLRQKFTSYERDTETDLDYAQARYYNSAQGRFTRPDPLLASGRIESPQTWNKYSYVLGNPLKFNDPLGLYEWDSSLGGDLSDDELRTRSKDKKNFNKKERKGFDRIRKKRDLIRKSIAKAKMAANSERLSDDQKAEVNKGLDAIGDENEKNGVKIGVGQLPQGVAGTAAINKITRDAEGNVTGALIGITISETLSSSSVLAAIIVHEGYHAAQMQAAVEVWASTGSYFAAYNSTTNLSGYDMENQAYRVTAYVANGLGRSSLTVGLPSGKSYKIWKRGMAEPDQRVLDALLKEHYEVTPDAPKPRDLLP